MLQPLQNAFLLSSSVNLSLVSSRLNFDHVVGFELLFGKNSRCVSTMSLSRGYGQFAGPIGTNPYQQLGPRAGRGSSAATGRPGGEARPPSAMVAELKAPR